jgi:exosortase J
MSAPAIDEASRPFSAPLSDRGFFFRSLPIGWICLCAAIVLGAVGLSPVLAGLWEIWTTDPLRSIGMLIVPTAIVLTAGEWRSTGWELRGSWWGLVPLALSYSAVVYGRFLILASRSTTVNLLPSVLCLYLFATGVVLLFAGWRVWRKAWFALILLLCAQPVPTAIVYLIDYPLQSFAAQTARAFASLIGFAPGNPDLLKLMFSPTFGMFIAPGCDGMRGAVGLGYAALIAGYIKRVSWVRWFLYVSGGVLLAHLFNLIRLCALVLYYRIAIGHTALENLAKQADYLIGGTLFFVAVLLFLAIIFRPSPAGVAVAEPLGRGTKAHLDSSRSLVLRISILCVLGLIATISGIKAVRIDRHSILRSLSSGRLKPDDLNNLLPKQIGDFQLVRAWPEQSTAGIVMELALYKNLASQEVTLGIWLPRSRHNAHDSWFVRGELPEMRAERRYVTAQRRVVSFDTALYSDGISDRFAGTVECTPLACRMDLQSMRLFFSDNPDFPTSSPRTVSIFFSIERIHDGTRKDSALRELSSEAQTFLSSVDLQELSRRFQ